MLFLNPIYGVFVSLPACANFSQDAEGTVLCLAGCIGVGLFITPRYIQQALIFTARTVVLYRKILEFLPGTEWPI